MGIRYCHGRNSKSQSIKILVPYEPQSLIPEKWCYRCRRHLPYTEFFLNKSRHDGYNDKCKECDKAYSRLKYRKRNI
jgi:hypothetical protein